MYNKFSFFFATTDKQTNCLYFDYRPGLIHVVKDQKLLQMVITVNIQ
jgi:hypothetical protein